MVSTSSSYLFQNVADAAIVALPFAEKEIRQSINSVLDNLGKANDYPNQVMEIIERSKMG